MVELLVVLCHWNIPRHSSARGGMGAAQIVGTVGSLCRLLRLPSVNGGGEHSDFDEMEQLLRKHGGKTMRELQRGSDL